MQRQANLNYAEAKPRFTMKIVNRLKKYEKVNKIPNKNKIISYLCTRNDTSEAFDIELQEHS